MKDFIELLKEALITFFEGLGLVKSLFIFFLALPLVVAGYATGFVIRAFDVGYSAVNKHLDKMGAGAKEALEELKEE